MDKVRLGLVGLGGHGGCGSPLRDVAFAVLKGNFTQHD